MPSHPLWVRGLKHLEVWFEEQETVAPFVGAWIETTLDYENLKSQYVAPFVGAWIETNL